MSDIRIIQEWLKYSQSDMLAARYMFYNVNPKQTEISVFHCQQCAEKALKAYLVAHELDPPKIHKTWTAILPTIRKGNESPTHHVGRAIQIKPALVKEICRFFYYIFNHQFSHGTGRAGQPAP